jgi:hypothetical protein
MKLVSLVSLATLVFTVSCSNKYDNKRDDLEKQEALEMVKKSNDVEIKKGWGNDKIILKDQ